MKKILLATTILGMTAGFAAAEVKFSGSASLGVARNGVSSPAVAAVSAVAGTVSAANVTTATALNGSAISGFTAGSTTGAQIVLINTLVAAKQAAVTADPSSAAAQEALEDAQALLAAISGTPAQDAIAADANDFQVYNSGTIDIAATVVSDSGVEFGVSTDVSFGNSYSFGDGVDAFASEGGTIGAPTLTAKGAFGTVTFANDGIDQLYSDDTAGDFSYAYSAGDLAFTLVYDVDASTAVDWSANAAYAISGVSMSLTSDSNDSYNASVSYTSGGITGTIETDSEAGADAVNTLTVAYAANGMSVEVSGDSADYTSIAVGYSANGLSVDVSTDSDDEWEATTSYDLGGGASLVAGVNHGEEAYAGVDLSF